MFRWNAETRSLTITVPRWRELLGYRWRQLFAIFLFILCMDGLMRWVDLPLAEFSSQITGWPEAFVTFMSRLGNSQYYLVPITLALPFILAIRQAIADEKGKKMLGWAVMALVFVFVAIAASGIAILILKFIFGRARPVQWFEDGEYGFDPINFSEYRNQSFPSGHANTAFALACSLAFFFPALRRVFFTLATIIALSRVAVTSHFLSDVIAGGLFGWASTMWLYRAFARRNWVFIRHKNEIKIAAPGVLLAQKIRAYLHDNLGLRWGARDRLPG